MAFADKQSAYKYVNEYQKQKYDRITILRKPGDKDKIASLAKEKGYSSVNDFINTCIDEKLKRMKVDL
ncbi:MAG: hypothetical protein J6Q48_01250 [Bacteroidaceae bacterium]|nr:hypothetical protein [Bacteroidaceae bacterium]